MIIVSITRFYLFWLLYLFRPRAKSPRRFEVLMWWIYVLTVACAVWLITSIVVTAPLNVTFGALVATVLAGFASLHAYALYQENVLLTRPITPTVSSRPMGAVSD